MFTYVSPPISNNPKMKAFSFFSRRMYSKTTLKTKIYEHVKENAIFYTSSVVSVSSCLAGLNFLISHQTYPIQLEIKSVDIKVNALDKRMDGLDKRMDGLDKRMDGLDKRIEGLSKTMEKQNQEMKDMIMFQFDNYHTKKHEAIQSNTNIKDIKTF